MVDARARPRPALDRRGGAPDVEVPAEHGDVVVAGEPLDEGRPRGRARPRGSRESAGELVACRFATTSRGPARTAEQMRRSFAQARRRRRIRPSSRPAVCRKSRGLSVSTSCAPACCPGPSRIALPWPSKADRKKPGFGAVSSRPSSVGIGTTPNRGRWATSPIAVMPLHAPNRASAHAGSSCRNRTSGTSSVASRIISSRCRRRVGGDEFPWKRFQLRISTALALLYDRRARRPRRPTSVYTAVRPRARRRPRAGGRRGRARHLALPVRRRPGPGRIHAQRHLLPAQLAGLSPLAPAASPEAARAPVRNGLADRSPARRAPRPVARGSAGRRRPLPAARADRLHGTRPAAAPHRPPREALAAAAGTLRPRRRPQRARCGDARRAGSPSRSGCA